MAGDLIACDTHPGRTIERCGIIAVEHLTSGRQHTEHELACLRGSWLKDTPDGSIVPVRQLIVVVLPAPLGPSRQNSWPLGMAK